MERLNTFNRSKHFNYKPLITSIMRQLVLFIATALLFLSCTGSNIEKDFYSLAKSDEIGLKKGCDDVTIVTIPIDEDFYVFTKEFADVSDKQDQMTKEVRKLMNAYKEKMAWGMNTGIEFGYKSAKEEEEYRKTLKEISARTKKLQQERKDYYEKAMGDLKRDYVSGEVYAVRYHDKTKPADEYGYTLVSYSKNGALHCTDHRLSEYDKILEYAFEEYAMHQSTYDEYIQYYEAL